MANTNSINLELSSSQYLSITDANQTGLDLSTDFTIEVWIKLEQLPSSASYMGLVNKDDASTNRSYTFRLNPDDTCFVNYWSDNSTQTNITSDTAIVVAGDVGNWVHLAVTVDISAQTAIMYKNGSAVATTTGLSGSTTIQNTSGPVEIGTRTNGDLYFDGLIDEVRVWSDIRTATEIADNYEKELNGDEAGLVGYWKLNNNLLDETTNNNDLTNNNSATFSTYVPFGTTNFFMMF
ncbi:MAG: LamG domain-containing protein [Patescibacteria group bacterium]|jgi:hypothetical protein|nr:LamG domain-containing protein [Patescibacteria group bacterium]